MKLALSCCLFYFEEETAHWCNEKNLRINSEVEVIGRQKVVTEPKDMYF